ncbi:MAG: bifunctional transcriptional activator/DNA repair enzyme AdaA, partial [Ignavibacteriales bacterium]
VIGSAIHCIMLIFMENKDRFNVMELTFDQKYNAVVNRDSSFEGIFVTAVKTTKIFCRPTCRAKKPKPENVLFFDSPREAMMNGFRPCKLCSPLALPGETPEAIRNLLQELHEKPYVRIKDSDLISRGVEPSQVRRWFKKNHRLTFQSYQRMLRINNAYQNIAGGEMVTEAAFGSGFNSLSGFNTRFQSVFGEAPSHTVGKSIINMIRIPTPLGPMFACATDNGICMLEFTDRRMLETEFRDLRRYLNAEILPGENEHLVLLQKELDEYFNGTRKEFTVRLDAPGTPFQKAVWECLLKIPYGETRSYKMQAILLGRPLAVRAVASANGCNRISIVIPCHRVIGENGDLTGYGGGLVRKKWLLEHEKKSFL